MIRNEVLNLSETGLSFSTRYGKSEKLAEKYNENKPEVYQMNIRFFWVKIFSLVLVGVLALTSAHAAELLSGDTGGEQVGLIWTAQPILKAVINYASG